MEDILSDNIRYHVARFQREYAWDKVDLKEFWEDINNNIIEKDEGYDTPEYFLGSFVFVKENDDATDLKIVDGQQRLTSIQLLFSNIVEALKGNDMEDEVQDVYKFIEGIENEKPYFRLQNENTNNYLRQRLLYVNKKEIPPSSAEEESLLFAYEFFEKELNRKARKLKEQYGDYLITLKRQLLNLQVIEITVDNEDEAYTIFEILNSKGHNLDNIDLIKNLIFQILDGTHPIDEAKAKWNSIKEKLRTRSEKINMDTFFRDYWLSYHGHVPKKNLYKAVREWINGEAENAIKVLNTMEKDVETYLKIVDPQPGDWLQEDFKQYYFTLKALKVFKVTTPRSLIMSVYRNFENRDGARKLRLKRDVIPLLEFIERFHFKFTAINSGRASGLEIIYGNWAGKIEDANSRQDVMAILEELKGKLGAKIPPQQTFVRSFGNLWFTNEETKDKKLIQYIFFNIERHIRQTNELIPGENSLDHLNPQSNVSLPEVGRMGNLLMVGKDLNERMGSKPFAEKKPMLKESELEVAKEFLANYDSKEEWSSQEINERTNEMAIRAYNVIWET
ncbi:GmrSD restriction endonuclease domain-containing protein [Halobacillus salinus]|uniref:GmrSD restriction endonuclease domain-containing protein n=1 Tax=Halobacillus salinus TaxID=192814 RepID=UPI0015927C27|nr:DUF262 domain-containing protein [Halobacillus salinus]